MNSINSAISACTRILIELIIIKLSYRVSLMTLIRFFSKNLDGNHLEISTGNLLLFNLFLKYAKYKKNNTPEVISFFNAYELNSKENSDGPTSGSAMGLIKGNLTSLPYVDRSFDSINMTNCIAILSNAKDSLVELHRVLNDDGILSINVLIEEKNDSILAKIANKFNLWCQNKQIMHSIFSIKQIKKILKESGFFIVDGYIKGNSYQLILKKQLAQSMVDTEKYESVSNDGDMMGFDYNIAFKRNIGWLKKSDIEIIKQCRIAIAGLGGAGGSHLMTLSRLGFEKFNIADFDIFELINFNRQVGASVGTIGKKKTEVMKKMLLDVNPNAQLRIFNSEIKKDNLDEFLDECDIYIDSVDTFSLDTRVQIFDRCRQLGIPVITAAPIGMGVSYLIFQPNEYTFNDYFDFAVNSDFNEKFIKFLIGLNPTLCSSRYLMEPSAVNIMTKDTTSLMIGCNLVAAVTATEVLKIALGRGRVYYAPYYHVFDAYLHKHKIGRLYFGNRSPLQKIKYQILHRKLFSNSD